MNTIIYYRKSTDRDDKQANSLEHQLNNCRKTAERFGLEIYEEIGESRSAKTEFTREKFNDMIKLCKTGKIDYIIVDEPKRLSRNNIDTSRIIDLMDKNLIKGVITTNREYYREHSRDKFFLQFDLALSKMDNEDRAKDVKDKMMTAFKKGKWMGVAPDGYKNVTISKGCKEIHIDREIAPHIKKMFALRCEGYSPVRIAEVLFEDGYKSKKGGIINHQQIRHRLENKFYMGIMVWNGEEYPGNYEPLVSKSTFYKANNIVAKSIYSKRNIVYPLTGLLFDTDKIPLRGNMTKGNIYYMHANRSKQKLNISQKKILEQAHTIFKDAEFPETTKKISYTMIENIFKRVQKKSACDYDLKQKEIVELKEKKERLIDAFIDGDISKNIYQERLNKLEMDIASREEKIETKKSFSREKLKKLKEKAELVFSLYSKQSELEVSEKLKILKSLKAELFINTKKELQIAESKLLSTLKLLHFPIWYTR